ncbi:MAG: hypothetical protein V4635_07050 [Bacteroidota bacterium]
MIKHIKIIILSSFLFAGFLTFGQDKPQIDGDQDKKYTPNPSSIFNSLNKKREDGGSSDVTIKNMITYCPTALFRQKVMFYCHRDLGQGIVVNLGLGKAFGDDVLQQVFLGIKSVTSDYTVLSSYDMLSNATYYSSTPYYYVGLRYYFSGNSFEEGFVDLAYRHESLEYLLNPDINSKKVAGSNSFNLKMNAFSFGYGYTILTGRKNNFSHEFFINFGIKYFKHSYFEVVQYRNPVTYVDEDVYVKSPYEKKMIIYPAINMGYSFGFGF